MGVVVPAYNAAGTLGACLVALQSAAPEGADIVVVDDGSTDATAQVAREAGVRVCVHDHNQGTSAARNTGWRAVAGDVVVFVDADVIVEPGAINALMRPLRADPHLLGANGLLSADPVPGFFADYANLSIHFQHLQHGERVSSAFTSLCGMRRTALEAMGGWEERFFSRYADDVNTRFTLPPGCLAMVAEARARHLKAVRGPGLFKHRFNIGFFWMQAMGHHARTRALRPSNAVLDLRYPLNTVIAAGLGLALVLPVRLPLIVGLVVLSAAANLKFIAFVRKHRSLRSAGAAWALSALEGMAFFAGICAAAPSATLQSLPLRRSHGHSRTPPR